jgi:integrase
MTEQLPKGVFKRGSTYWIHYSLRGQVFRESAHTDRPEVAIRLRKQRLKEIAADQIGAKVFIPPKATKVTISELLDSLERNLELEHKLSPSVRANIRHLRKKFGNWFAMSLTADAVEKYISELLADQYRPATVNRRTQLLQQAYNLSIRMKRLNEKPYFKRLSEKGNVRTGFSTETEVKRIAAHLPEHIADVALFGFYSAWRKGEILSLEWRDVQLDSIHLRAENSKERETRTLALEGELMNIIERRREKRSGPLVFHNGTGAPVVDFRKCWRTACKMAGCPGRLFHDLRRSGVRDLIRAGTAPHIAMSISGHKTDSMLRRYAIISEADQRAGLRRTQEHRQAEAGVQMAGPVLTTVQ